MTSIDTPLAAVAASPADEHFRRASFYSRKQRWAEAHEAFGAALAAKSDAPAEWYFGMGRAAENLGKAEEARARYQTALGLKADVGEWHFRLGVVEQASGRLAEAEAALRKALETGPARPEWYVHLAQVLKALGRKSANEYLKKSLPLFALAAGGDGALFQSWARVLYELEHYRDAVPAAVEAVRRSQGSAAWRFLGRLSEVLGEKGEIQSAFAHIRPLWQETAMATPARTLYLRLCVRFAYFDDEAVDMARAATAPGSTDLALKRAALDLLHVLFGSSLELGEQMEALLAQSTAPDNADLLQMALIWLRLKKYPRLKELCARYPVLDMYHSSHPAIAYAGVKLGRLAKGTPEHAEATAVLGAYDAIVRAQKTLWARVGDRQLGLAIVGNSECEFGRGRGPEIDAHDIVLRFNSFSLNPPYDADYGRKTDLHVRPSRDLKKYQNKGTLNTVISGIRMLDRAKAVQWKLMRALVEEGHQLACFPEDHQHELIMKLRRAPSAGLTAAWVASRLRKGTHKTSYYGFSFLDQLGDNAKSAHYFEKSLPSGRHGWDAEAEYFQQITGTTLSAERPPPPPKGPRIKLLGDHAAYHAGSSAVVDYLHKQIAAVDGVLVDGDDYDALVINGEGTMHHDTKGFALKMQELGEAMGLRRKAYLINTVWEQNGNDFDGILRNLDGLIVREQMSHEDLLKRHGIKAQVGIDISYWADVDESAEFRDLGGKMAVGDFYSDDFGCFVRLTGGPLSKHPFIDMREMSWSTLVKTLRTSSLLVTGRHHAVFAACRAKIPFVALQGNTHKIEGLIKSSGLKIPTCSRPRDLRRCMAWATANRSAYDELFAWMSEQPPFRMAELLAGGARPSVATPPRRKAR